MKYNLFSIFVIIFLISCNGREINNPKPRGYFRIDLPKKSYVKFSADCPYSFEYPVYARVEKDTDANTQPYCYNIQFPTMKATIHLSYRKIENNLMKILEDCRALVYKHTVKDDAIDDNMIQDKKRNLYGLTYDIKGDAVS